NAGIEVDVGCLGDVAARTNQPFQTFITEKRPFVTGKIAVARNGKIGVTGKRIQLSGWQAEKTTMRLRAEAGAIVVGANTVIADAPLLTVRGKYSHRFPIRAVIDPTLRTPPDARLFHEKQSSVWIFTSEDAPHTSDGSKRKDGFTKHGARVISLPVGPNRR